MQYLDDLGHIFWMLLPTILSILAPIVVLLARAAVKKLTTHLDVRTSAAIMDVVNGVVMNGVALAEQEAKKHQLETQEKLVSQNKLEIAMEYVIDELNKHNIPQLTQEEIIQRIEACLGIGTLNQNFNVDGDGSGVVNE